MPSIYSPFSVIYADDMDDAVVLRLMAGDPPDTFTSFERREAVRRLKLGGCSYSQIAQRLRIGHRQVTRDLHRFGLVTPRAVSVPVDGAA